MIVPLATLPVLSANMLSPTPNPSSIISLRCAMDPFLKGSPTTPKGLTPTTTHLIELNEPIRPPLPIQTYQEPESKGGRIGSFSSPL